MTTKDEALQMALEALAVATTPLAEDRQRVLKAIAACREALAQKDGQEIIGRTVSMCVSSGDEGEDRIFGSIYEVQEDEMEPGGVIYLAIAEDYNFVKPKLTDEEIIWMIPGLVDSLNDPYEQTPGDSVSSIKFDMVRLVRAVEAYYRIGVEE